MTLPLYSELNLPLFVKENKIPEKTQWHTFSQGIRHPLH